jgi:glycerol uptake facilitator-like aquaporin
MTATERPHNPQADPWDGPVAPLSSRLLAEAIGSGFLVVAVIGSGITAQTLSPGDVGLQLLENAAATAGALVALIIMFATVSGAHFNPAVTLVDRLLGGRSTRDASLYVVAQLVGGCLGALLTNAMYTEQTGRGLVFISGRDRTSGAQLLSEGIATLGLILVIHGAIRYRKPYVVGVAVGVWIGGAYFFTSSTSFANPMISIARTLSDTFAGIAPASAAAYVVVELLGALVAVAVIPLLFRAGDLGHEG